ncbi:TPA: anti-sigma factor antagonist [Candidatus Berkelbacteria bacterium]|uniref:Anti-sigma factor antagonist n=1 Tax=Berkelbacteria bacterium GW2011_GWE1_39_12 TaxID=1618337 RepID=A0A0G4B3M4_9BACT|nr:MAG: anti-sigma factor antagonist [Berkelbacteria bacterium GW2011_GWE1_39_12]HBO60589.1 anti-sigma factor antagonist [Candidatus Berkelbacteria bacterium]
MKLGTRTIGEGICVIDVSGEIDVYTSPRLKQQINGCFNNRQYRIVVNLTEAEYLDASALGILISGLKGCREQNGTLLLICPKPRVLKIFEITGLNKIFEIFLTTEEALEKIGATEQASPAPA